MQRKIWLSFLFISAVLIGETPFNKNSSLRYSWESYQDAVERHLKRGDLEKFPFEKTAYSEAVVIDKLDSTNIPDLGSNEEVRKLFEKIRDERFIDSTESPDFPRRSTWLYPADGCWARAALVGKRIVKMGLKRPHKLFVFGNLKVTTANSVSGSVGWWYHVVPVLVSSNGVKRDVLVFDPAIDPKSFMDLNSWLNRMGDPRSFKVSVCNPYTFGPNSPCYTSDETTEKYAFEDQERYLKAEWDNLVSLKREPEKELGSLPPWK